MAEQIDLILIGGIVVTMNAGYDLFPEGAVAIDGDTIVAQRG